MIYTAPREIVGSIGGIEIKEMKSRDKSFCCGVWWWKNVDGRKHRKKVNVERSQEAIDTGADELLLLVLSAT